MSPTRPDPADDAGAGAPERPEATPRTTAVSGAAALQARVELQLSQCRRRGGVLALLHIGVETVSLEEGELGASLEQRVRQEVSNRIANAVRGSDAILRESDRDTWVVLPDADAAVAARVARRLERVANGEYRIAGKRLQVRVRLGVASNPHDGSRAPELLRKAGDRG